MERIAWLSSLVICCGLVLPASAEKRSPNKEALALQEALQEAIEEAEPSVACILVSRSDKYQVFNEGPSPDRPGILGEFKYDYGHLGRDNPRRILASKLDLSNVDTVPESFGSGVVIDDKEALILTNYHVVKDATKVFVRLPGGKTSYANIYAADPRSDLAVLQLITRVTLRAIKLGDASKARKGQMVLTIANPYAAGFNDGSPSASWGIISNLRRRAPARRNESELDKNRRTLHHYGTLIQTDARLNLGCSGGALIDLNGELIGLTTSLAALTGAETPGGFAVPIDAGMRRIIDTLRQGKEVEYGFLGVSFRDPAQVRGAVQLGEVFPGSPAFRAGLSREDVILSVNGTPIQTVDDIFLPLAKLAPQARVQLDVSRMDRFRRPRRLKITVVLAKYAVHGKIIAQNRPEFRGLRVDYASLAIQPPFSLLQIPRGVLVVEVKETPNRPDLKALKVGDVVTQVNGRAVANPEAFYQAVKDLKGAVELTLASGDKVKIEPDRG